MVAGAPGVPGTPARPITSHRDAWPAGPVHRRCRHVAEEQDVGSHGGDVAPQDAVLELRGITKNFGPVSCPRRGRSPAPREGSCSDSSGDNGAGKSTLTKILSGAYVPDSGTILMNGAEVRIRNPGDAHRLGIEMIYQDLALFDNLDVASNLFVGRERLVWG